MCAIPRTLWLLLKSTVRIELHLPSNLLGGRAVRRIDGLAALPHLQHLKLVLAHNPLPGAACE